MKDDEPPIATSPIGGMPETRIGRWVQPFARFLQIQSASGFLLLACTAVALLLANSPWSTSFAEIWQIRLRIAVGDFELNKPLLLCINDGLMTVFFFVVGLEIKREFVAGELRDRRKAALPIAAGLVLGKPIGVVLFSWIATRLGFARLPAGVNWKIMLGAGCLTGIGFTMSIFIAGLALERDLLDDGKIGTLIGSTISAILGCSLLLMFMPKRSEATVGVHEQQTGGEEMPGPHLSEENEQIQSQDRWRDDGCQDGFDKEEPS